MIAHADRGAKEVGGRGPTVRPALTVPCAAIPTQGTPGIPGLSLEVYAALADGPAEPGALRGLVLGVAGTGLVVPAVGVEVFATPVIGGLYIDGVTGVAPALASIYRGPMTPVMIVGLIILAVGAIDLARAVWRRSPGRRPDSRDPGGGSSVGLARVARRASRPAAFTAL